MPPQWPEAGIMPSPMPSTVLQQGLQALRDGFLERITARCLAIEGILADAAENDEDTMSQEAARDAIHRHAHKTAGVAATFGFSLLGEKALAVEQLMSRTKAPPALVSRPPGNRGYSTKWKMRWTNAPSGPGHPQRKEASITGPSPQPLPQPGPR
jgi:HPt (histidine-containing phosphotransfer) domain-containing protein